MDDCKLVSQLMGSVVSVHRSGKHGFSKQIVPTVELLAGLGIAGDAHLGQTVQHRYDKRKDPTRPNLRQVHLLAAEFLDSLAAQGFAVQGGDLGENISTRGLALPQLPVGTRLHLGAEAVVELTGLRNPCVLIDRFRPGLLAQFVHRGKQGKVTREAGVMGVVLRGGLVQAGHSICAELPAEPHQSMRFV